MTTSSADQFFARAEADGEIARTATLDQVRERALRSQAAWVSMGERALRVVEERRVADEARAVRASEGALQD